MTRMMRTARVSINAVGLTALVHAAQQSTGRVTAMDKLHALRTFVRIAEEGGLSAAARALGTSTPAVLFVDALRQALHGFDPLADRREEHW